MRKRAFIKALAGAALATTIGPVAGAAAPARTETLYIGTQGTGDGHGIFAAQFDPRDGALVLTGLAATIARPTWLLPHPRLPLLYAVSDPGADSPAPHRIVTYRSDAATGALREIASTASGGRGPTHLDFHRASSTLFVANYVTATPAALPVAADGTPGEPSSTQTNYGTGPNRRQTAPHAHGVAFDTGARVLLVPDLGADRMFLYRFATRQRSLAPNVQTFVQLPAGSGPRHVAVHPGGRFVYLITELRPAIDVFRWSASRDRLEPVETIATMPDDAEEKNKGAEIAVSADGRFLYSSHRGEDFLLVHAIDRSTGKLRELQRIPSGGHLPWHFTIHPGGRWMLVANQGTGSIAVFKRDPRTGLLAATSNRVEVGRPTNVTFLFSASR